MIRKSLPGFHGGIHLGFEPLNFADAFKHRGKLLAGHHHDAVAVGDHHIKVWIVDEEAKIIRLIFRPPTPPGSAPTPTPKRRRLPTMRRIHRQGSARPTPPVERLAPGSDD